VTLRQIDGLGRVREINSFFLELAVNPEIDSLLHIHVAIVVRVQHILISTKYTRHML